MRYTPDTIEPKWQHYWQKNGTFKTPEMPTGEKLYALDMFPYPSGNGLHVGHPEGYTATDIVCRFARMRGKAVLHPMGFDAFGLPAEEHAIKTGVHPRINTEDNIRVFRRQLKSLGFSYDWDRELATTDVDYFTWTQFIFLVLFDTWFDAEQQKGRPISELSIPADVKSQGDDAVRRYRDEQRLAFQSDALVNWCPALATVLANEEVIDGKSERGNHPVVRMPLRQWMLRITAYADRLEKGLDTLDWSEGIKALQRNWIGKSTGAEVDFFIGRAGSVSSLNPRDTEQAFAAWKTARAQSGYPRKPTDDVLRIYTTRPDTLFGATYMVIAPEHPFVDRLTTPAQAAAVKQYREAAAAKSDRERTEDAKKKTGVFTGSYAINPVNGEQTPIWIADYVLISYGTGAIMAVPAHDERDMEFAKQYDIPIVAVVDPGNAADVNRDAVLAGEECFADNGTAINSGKYNGLATLKFKQQISADLTAAGVGREAVNYKLRDWLFSRQRFWGEPFPILHEVDASGKPTGVVRAVEPSELPVDLPHLDDFKPHGKPEPPLGKAPDEWLYVERDGKRYKRETNTMPQWAGSCWYYLRFIDPKNDKALVDREKEKAWMPVDLYVGGAEHAVLHLLYSRFWHKVLFDRGYVSTDEPFQKLVNQGMILGEPQFHLSEADYKANERAIAERGMVVRRVEEDGDVSYILGVPGATDEEMKNVPEDQSEKRQGQFYLKGTNIALHARSDKMSKSRGNVINPDVVVREYGADSLRLFEMFMGPLEATKPWSTAGVSGVRGFLDRAWRMIVDHLADGMSLHAAVQDLPPTPEQNRMLHQTIGAVTKSLETMSFNTGIARLMEFVNFFTRETVRPRACMEPLVLMLAPYAPHIAEELWEALGKKNTLAYEAWPQFDAELAKEDTIEIPVQINGKLRAKINVPPETSKEDLEKLALADAKVQELLAGKSIVKTIGVAGRMVNFVVK